MRLEKRVRYVLNDGEIVSLLAVHSYANKRRLYFLSNAARCTSVSRPRFVRLSSQIRSSLDSDSVVSRPCFGRLSSLIR